MATAILDLEATALPDWISVAPHYDRALCLIRWRGVPVGRLELPVRRQGVGGDPLVQAVVDTCGGLIGHYRMEDFLGQAGAPGSVAQPPSTVAVCTRDRPDDLTRCLAALAALPNDGQEVLVIDSASRSSSTREVAAQFPSVRYVREERPGLDRARNRALDEARHEVVAFTDDDAAPDRWWLRTLVSNFAEARTLCVTGLTMPIELETEAQEWFERTNGFGRGFQRVVHDGAEHDPFVASRVGAGVNMALRRSVVDQVGPFDVALDAGTPTKSGGDHDMFTRILARGYQIVYDPRALNWHRHRREWAELREAIFGYGVGVYAYLTRLFLSGETRAVVVAAKWLPWQLRLLARGLLGRPAGMPPALALSELRGCLAGPFAYLKSRRQAASAA